MKTAAQKTLFKAFETSSVENGIKAFPEKLKQARWSGASYRCTVEAQKRKSLAYLIRTHTATKSLLSFWLWVTTRL